MHKSILAIDPDVQKSGVARLSNGVITKLEKLTFAELVDVFSELDESTVVLIENVELINTTFKRSKTNAAAMNKIAQNVGMVKGTYRHLVAMAEHYGVNITPVPPLGIRNPTARRAKQDAEFFKKLTGYQGRTNEDTRDAGMIAFLYK